MSSVLPSRFETYNSNFKRLMTNRTTTVLKWITNNGDLDAILTSIENAYKTSDADPVFKEWKRASIVAESVSAEYLLDNHNGMKRLMDYFEHEIVDEDGNQSLFPYKTTLTRRGQKYTSILVSRDTYRWGNLLNRYIIRTYGFDAEKQQKSALVHVKAENENVNEEANEYVSEEDLDELLLPFTGLPRL